MEGAGRWCEAARLTRSDSSRRMPEWGAIGTFVPGVFPAQPFMETAGIEPAKRSRRPRIMGGCVATLERLCSTPETARSCLSTELVSR